MDPLDILADLLERNGAEEVTCEQRQIAFQLDGRIVNISAEDGLLVVEVDRA